MKIILCVVLGLVLLGVVAERLATQEYIAYLRLQLRLEQVRPALTQGMSEDEAKRVIGVVPDRVSPNVDENGTKVLVWSPRKQLGFFYHRLSFNNVDTKDFMDMFLDFDSEGRLRRIYFGG